MFEWKSVRMDINTCCCPICRLSKLNYILPVITQIWSNFRKGSPGMWPLNDLWSKGGMTWCTAIWVNPPCFELHNFLQAFFVICTERTSHQSSCRLHKSSRWVHPREMMAILWTSWDMDASENSGTPKSSILIGFSIINHPFWGTPIFGNTHMFFSWLEPSTVPELVCLKHLSGKIRNLFVEHKL